jgi:hypothetical protein
LSGVFIGGGEVCACLDLLSLANMMTVCWGKRGGAWSE